MNQNRLKTLASIVNSKLTELKLLLSYPDEGERTNRPLLRANSDLYSIAQAAIDDFKNGLILEETQQFKILEGLNNDG